MIEYVLEGTKYLLSYQQLKEEYVRFCYMSDDEFMNNLPAAAHLACVICYLKEIPGYVALSDIGIVHQLVHLIHIPTETSTPLADIRKLFEEQLKLH